MPDAAIIVNYGLVAYGSFTVGTTFPVLTANHIIRELMISNTLNADMVLTLDGVAWLALPSSSGGGTTPYKTYIPQNTIIGAIPMVGSPTSGWLGLTGN